ncbi:aldose 1-epimerase family protein [Xylanimonas protaetiae]|nr:aldose 1-epimerase family protein [Xylanimonas protaetiae]
MGQVPLSGEQYVLEGFGYRAEVAAVGATLRTLSAGGRELVAGFSADRLRPAMRGALLVPWPNRTADGAYTFAGETHRLPVDEPETRTATHGLLAWSPFTPGEPVEHGLELRGTLAPRPGYPWRLGVTVTFTLAEDGLRQEVEVENQSDRTAPVGIGGHPYLVAGPSSDSSLDGWTLELDAAEALVPSPDRMLPERTVHVDDAPELDFRAPRTVGDTVLNHCFTGLRPAADGTVSARLRDPRGGGTQITWDARCAFVQLYSADHPVDGVRRSALAIEPMTCQPDALNSGVGLLAVDPWQAVGAGWRIGAL